MYSAAAYVSSLLLLALRQFSRVDIGSMSFQIVSLDSHMMDEALHTQYVSSSNTSRTNWIIFWEYWEIGARRSSKTALRNLRFLTIHRQLDIQQVCIQLLKPYYHHSAVDRSITS